MSNIILVDKFNAECTAYLHSKLQTHLLSTADPTAGCQYYFTEYQRCMDEQRNAVQYMEEQLASLEALKSCETTIDAFFERLKAVHQYERKQNEIFEQILHQLNKAVGNSLNFLLKKHHPSFSVEHLKQRRTASSSRSNR